MDKEIPELVLECIASGAVDRNKVRQIIVGPSRRGQSINIWQEEKSDGYIETEPEDSQAIAHISNDDWLSSVDRIGFLNDPPWTTARHPRPIYPVRACNGHETELEPEFHRQLSRDQSGALAKTKKGIFRADRHSGTWILAEMLEDGGDDRALVGDGRTLYAAIKAADEDPETLHHFDNLAEVYHKMGETAKACEWASEARRRGSKAAMLDEILSKSPPGT